MRAWLSWTLALSLLVSVGSRSVSAQTPRTELETTYSWQSGTEGETYSYPFGWSVSGIINVTPWLGVVGSAAGAYHRDHIPDLPAYTYRGQAFTLSQHSFLGGPRAVARLSPTLAAYGQVLLGTHRFAGDPAQPMGSSLWSLVVQPGGGVKIALSQSIDIIGTLEVPLIRLQSASVQNGSVVIGHTFYRATRVGGGLSFQFGSVR